MLIVLTYSWLAFKNGYFIAVGECLRFVEACLAKLHVHAQKFVDYEA